MIQSDHYPSSSAYSFLEYLLTSSPLCPNSLLNAPFSNTFHRRTSFNMTEHFVPQWLQKLIKLMAFQIKKIICNYKKIGFVSKHFNGQNLLEAFLSMSSGRIGQQWSHETSVKFRFSFF